MMRRGVLAGGVAALAAVAGGLGWWTLGRGTGLPARRTPVSPEAFAAAYQPIPAPQGPLRVYHLGHSLVGRDMPLILAQFAGHRFHSQLGWGSSLRNHWAGPEAVNGFETENAHAFHRPVQEALASGEYDAVIFTEMVELRDAITWHASPHYLAEWAKLARKGNPDARLYLYESWHSLDTPDGWENRLTRDLPELWMGELLRGAMAWDAPPISVIPGGQVLLQAVRQAEAGALPGVTSRAAFFGVKADGTADPIHPSPLGAYVVALAHYATLYQKSPEGLPAEVDLADHPRLSLPADLALSLQRLAWDVVRATPYTGFAA